MRRLTVLLWLLILPPWLSTNIAPAAFVLDDFDDPATVVSPSMEGDLIQTPNVGDLSALRSLNITGRQSVPVASVEVNGSSSSRFKGTMLSVMSDAGDIGSGELGLGYSTQVPYDYTDDSKNSAIYIDISEIDGATPPPWLYVLVRDNNDSFELFYPLSGFQSPGTAELRFNDFRPRGGGIDTTEFRSVTNLIVIIFGPGLFDSVEDRGWSIEIDRVRVGIIPEPCSVCLLWLASVLIFLRGRVSIHYH